MYKFYNRVGLIYMTILNINNGINNIIKNLTSLIFFQIGIGMILIYH
jgi:hypothetical protein